MKFQFEFIEQRSVRILIRMHSGSTLKSHETKTKANVKYLASFFCYRYAIYPSVQRDININTHYQDISKTISGYRTMNAHVYGVAL